MSASCQHHSSITRESLHLVDTMSEMHTLSPHEKAEYLIKSLEDYGQGDYIGESISQLEHSLQAAHQAQKSRARNDLIIAALFHDIGQIIPLSRTKDVRMTLKESGDENVGRIGHESIGAEFLRSLGFGKDVCRLVESHVDAKRCSSHPYLVHFHCRRCPSLTRGQVSYSCESGVL
ncbi:uncharacterized protein BJX67DRAFT_356895 [Aspergillus lucknowensis]|uniref:HD domain-containing protein n=1 Tax=Aspergillus lucknowensis TaxID=176173 RepID=A0ABR4LNK1_9EURO